MSSITETESGVVYLLTSPSGKQYVGQSWDYNRRMSYYRRGKCKSQRVLYRAIKKYGWDNFTSVCIVQGIQTQEWLDKIETAYIKAFNTLSPHGYNMTTGGEGGKPCAETRKKIGDARRGKPSPNKGKEASPETRAKMSAANRGKKHSAETIAKMSAAKRGKTKSLEHRAKLSAANRGRSPWNKGKSPSAETRAKLRASHLGKSKSPEHRAKMSASQQARRARSRAHVAPRNAHVAISASLP